MSWPSSPARRALFALLLLPLAGCGFEPLYAPRERAQYDPLLASIEVRPIPDRIGQLLEDNLREQLNPTDAAVPPRYRLDVRLTVSRADLGIQVNATAVRGELTLTATYGVTELRTNRVVFTSASRSTSAFNILNDAYASQVAEDAARARAIEDLGQEIGLRLVIFARQHQSAAGPG